MTKAPKPKRNPRAGRKHRIPKCRACGNVTTVIRSERFDAYYCNTCNKWLEPTCDDPHCFFCADRPAKPFPSRQ